jgi:hypothetical protein
MFEHRNLHRALRGRLAGHIAGRVMLGITLRSGCDPVSAVGTSDAFSERVLKAQP